MLIEDTLEVNETLVFPVKITLDHRKRCSANIGKKSLNIKLPIFLSKEKQAEEIAFFKKWALKHLQKKAVQIQNAFEKNYKHGDILKVREKSFQILIKESLRKNYFAKITEGFIQIETPLTPKNEEKDEATRVLIMKTLANYFYVEIGNRLLALNQLHFQKKVTGFSLKYMTSRWGSCSSKGTISISSRLLLAPNFVMDYVLIHELAHRVHMNHSAAFWGEVSKAMPAYEKAEIWLRENDYHADF